MKNLLTTTIGGVLIFSLLALGCTSQNKLSTSSKSVQCLNLLDPFSYENFKFNPEWIANNYIQEITETEYFHDRNGTLHLVSKINYNEDGYPLSKIYGREYPEDDNLNENNLSEIVNYSYGVQDSFVIPTLTKIKYADDGRTVDESKTTKPHQLAINKKNAKQFVDGKNESVFTYEYDYRNRLVKIKDVAGESLCTIEYLVDNQIEIEKWSFKKGRDFKSKINFNKKGQIEEYYDRSIQATSTFTYNKEGQLVEENLLMKNGEKIIRTYEYVFAR